MSDDIDPDERQEFLAVEFWRATLSHQAMEAEFQRVRANVNAARERLASASKAFVDSARVVPPPGVTPKYDLTRSKTFLVVDHLVSNHGGAARCELQVRLKP